RTPLGVVYVRRSRTYGTPSSDLPYVRRGQTGCPTPSDGILFFSVEQFAVPLLIISRCWVGAVHQIGEAIVRSYAATIEPEMGSGGLAQEAVMLKLGVPASDCVLVHADHFRGNPASEVDFAIVKAVAPQLAA